VRLYKFPVVMVILLLALLPAVLYAETVHEGHGGATVPLSQKQNVSTPAAGQTEHFRPLKKQLPWGAMMVTGKLLQQQMSLPQIAITSTVLWLVAKNLRRTIVLGVTAGNPGPMFYNR